MDYIAKRIKSVGTSMLVIILIFVGIRYYQWSQYKEKYDSTEWYEVTAEYDSYYKHTETEWENEKWSNGEMHGGSYQVDYYDWYYNYTAENGEVYRYTDKNNTEEPKRTNYTLTILVDKNDPSHAMEKQTAEVDRYASVQTIGIVALIGVVVVVIGIFVYKMIGTTGKKQNI